MMSLRAAFHAFWMIQDRERSCRVASSPISFSISSGKYRLCFRLSLSPMTTDYVKRAPDANTGPELRTQNIAGFRSSSGAPPGERNAAGPGATGSEVVAATELLETHPPELLLHLSIP